MDYISSSTKETEKLAQKFLNLKPNARLIGLSGDLGSGKTVFVKGVAKELGINKNITSPTFVVEKIYQHKSGKLIHIDAYRLSSFSDLEVLGFNELLSDKKNIIMIEWPELVFSQYPETMEIIKFSYVNEKQRKISW
ncbi:tRNA (adenosine(37)-N6)-threonylcarbamoyltransferase complex ATPase subunit type 1 TsaE [Candidatus Berkelbacteria bacterium CG08_land_8_20_14_0_20_39_8]|uniref:tRNA threonylcarbamoyladenosine biosynthesis protein TsaE n=1 Tax=Candidatus Berkelbacteria bacterium CG08_land_8_20_14_0_20_39_8 TaxID=1974511 RepID=A0A2M6YC19_9BACT|nr:MAG: tRNA (adenosine(37)-N6)-threonylcarbamoyltransferase complex ATPase subunit type 1 TsaE [Candidatus Berkelbacteria bacterium CG08_land_8_20_14_0_20_39_8]